MQRLPSVKKDPDESGDLVKAMVGEAVVAWIPVPVGGMNREYSKVICRFDVPPQRVPDHRRLRRVNPEVIEGEPEVSFRRFTLSCALWRHHYLEEMIEPGVCDSGSGMGCIRIGNDCHGNAGPGKPQ